MQASVGGSLKAAADRMAGTLVGAAYGAVVAVAIPHDGGIGLTLAIVVAVAPMALLAAIKASFRVAPITALIVLVPLRSQIGSPLDYALDRVAEIALGNLIGVGVALFVLPARAHSLVTGAAARSPTQCRPHGGPDRRVDDGGGRPAVAAIHARIRASLKAMEAAADEATRGRKGHVIDRADPQPLLRSLYRVRHDLVMAGRATARPLPGPVADTLLPCLFALRDAAVALLRAIAIGLRTGGSVVPDEAFDAALKSYVGDMDRLRADGQTRSLAGEDVGRLYALRFAFEQLGLDLRDLSARVREHAGQDMPEDVRTAFQPSAGGDGSGAALVELPGNERQAEAD